MASFRSKAEQARYAAHQKTDVFINHCVLCDEASIKEFTYWRVIPNDFPWDLVAQTHHLLIPRRHVTEGELTVGERDELREIKRTYAETGYDFMIEAAHRHKSIPAHFHLHLLTIKELE